MAIRVFNIADNKTYSFNEFVRLNIKTLYLNLNSLYEVNPKSGRIKLKLSLKQFSVQDSNDMVEYIISASNELKDPNITEERVRELHNSVKTKFIYMNSLLEKAKLPLIKVGLTEIIYREEEADNDDDSDDDETEFSQ